MAKRHTKSRRGRKVRRGRKATRGGGYSFGAAVAPEAPYASEVIGGPKLIPDCLDAVRPGLTTANAVGLPGFAGGQRMNLDLGEPGAPLQGGRRMKGGQRMSLDLAEPGAPLQGGRRMKGGRYTADLGAGILADAAGPGFAGYPVISRIGCEGGLVNTSPPGALANPTPLLAGGANDASYIAPTAGYSNGPSTFVDSVGAPVLLQQPYDARIMNPACLKTGGSRRRRSSKGRKVRKSTRKYRK